MATPVSTNQNIVSEYLQSEFITLVERPAFSPRLNPAQNVWRMLGQRVSAIQPCPIILPGLWRVLLAEGSNHPQDQPYSLILSMPRNCTDCFPQMVGIQCVLIIFPTVKY
ncbi:transposable element Tc3 transposase [Trichonephila clavipes]|nr:transposable element Tc3 transposase [Trichonephila clavipes]